MHVIFHFLLLSVCCLSLLSPSVQAEMGKIELRDWLLCGAFPGIGGLGSNGHRLESRLRPTPGDREPLAALNKKYSARWKRYRSPGEWVDLDADDTFRKRPAFGYPRGCAYASVYVRAPEVTAARLEVSASIGYPIVWWGTRRVSPPSAVRVSNECERLLIKLIHPRVNEPGFKKPWKFRVRIRQENGAPVEGLETRLDDPERLSKKDSNRALLALAEKVSLQVRPDRPAFTFLPGDNLRLNLEFRVEDTGPAHVTVRWELSDFDDRKVAGKDERIEIGSAHPGTVNVNPGLQPIGFYNLWVTVRSGKWVLRRFGPFGCAVVQGPVTTGRAPRKLSSSFYWLRPNHYIEWLHRIGMVRNVGLQATWWTKNPESAEFKPGIDKTVALGQEYGVELVGYLDGGWPASMNPKLHLKPDQLFVWFWQPLPECGSAEYERIVRQYVRRTVTRYRGRIRVWKSYNEIDLSPMPPERYAYIQRLVAEEVKKADPDAIVLGASFTKPPEKYWDKVIAAGGLEGHDLIDLHCYPLYPPGFRVPCNLASWKVHGASYNAAVVKAGQKPRPVWWGEVGAYRSLSQDGATGQADFFMKMNAVAFADPNVEVIAWCDPMGEQADDFALMHKGRGASPAVCAANVAAHFLDGRRPRILRQDTVQAAQFTGTDDEVLAVWTGKRQKIALAVEGNTAERIDVVGRRTSLTVVDGVCLLEAGPDIQLVRAKAITIH